jgi:hypothetical protein
MTINVKHNKTNAIADWTQADLDAQIALGNFPAGTLLANIVLPSDWNDDHDLTGLGTMADQDADAVAITGGTINGTSIGATTPSTGKFTAVTTPSVTATITDLTLSAISTGAVNLNTANGTQFRVNDTFGGGTSAAYWNAYGATSQPRLRALSSSNAWVETSGTGSLVFATNSGVVQQVVSHTASAVNYVQVTGGPTGGAGTTAPAISSQGSDANIDLNLFSKGTGTISFRSGTGRQFAVLNTSNAVNILTTTGSTAGNPPTLGILGSDTNIDLALTPKGTGLVRFGTYVAGATLATGYINIKAADGNTYKVLVST